MSLFCAKRRVMNGPDDYEGTHDYDMYDVYWWKSDFTIYDTQFLIEF